MQEDELSDRLRELHYELEEASHLSSDKKDVLGNLMKDIVVLASDEEGSSKAADDNPAEKKTGVIMRQLEKQANDFENQHPRLSGVIRQVMDALGKMGI